MKNTESKQGNSDRTSYIFSRLTELADTHVANVEKKSGGKSSRSLHRGCDGGHLYAVNQIQRDVEAT